MSKQELMAQEVDQVYSWIRSKKVPLETKNKKMKVLVACEFSGIVREAFRKKGHDAWSCDLLDTEIPGQHIKGDVLEILDNGWDLMIAHPPCTYTALSGNRHYANTELRSQGIEFFRKFLDANIPKIAVEHPMSVISTAIRKPDQYIQPYEFGHGETKKTGLWLKNLPLLQPTKIVPGRRERVYRECSGPDRWKKRSRTLLGIAEAMANQWGKCT